MGTNDRIGFGEDYEGPTTIVHVPSFSMADTPVTNADFDDFIAATAYQTVAERLGSSFVFELLIPEEERVTYQHVAGAPWWLLVPGTDWQHPYGAESSNTIIQSFMLRLRMHSLIVSGHIVNCPQKLSGNMRLAQEQRQLIRGENRWLMNMVFMRILGKEIFQTIIQRKMDLLVLPQLSRMSPIAMVYIR